MSHLDEGTLHALLDGELEMSEVKEIQAHLGSCSACGTRLRQVKEFYAEADRLVGALELPGAAAAGAAGAASRSRTATLEPPVERPPEPARMAHAPEGPPPIFLPDNPDWSERSRRFLVPMKWAALLVVAVGAGFLASEVRREHARAPLPGDLYDSTAPVLSTEEATPRPDTGAVAGSTARLEAPADERKAAAPTARTPAQSKAAAPAPQPAAPARARDTAEEVVDSATAANDQEVELAERSAKPVVKRSSAREAAPAPGNVRDEAARALEELDRERRKQRAAAATAAIDSARRRTEATRQAQSRAAAVVTPTNPAPAPATTAPPQRTLEQRAETYMRIGLDEAARQLGRPVHVIEGLSPLFMGLAQGRTSPGADTSRPVVRVVYQDAQGRLILLDQQRLKAGQDTSAPAGGQPHWTMGDVMLHLHGEIGPEVLRTMRARVR